MTSIWDEIEEKLKKKDDPWNKIENHLQNIGLNYTNEIPNIQNQGEANNIVFTPQGDELSQEIQASNFRDIVESTIGQGAVAPDVNDNQTNTEWLQQHNQQIIEGAKASKALEENVIEPLQQGFAQNEIIASYTPANNPKYEPKGLTQNLTYGIGMLAGFGIDLLPINKVLQVAGVSSRLYKGANIISKAGGDFLPKIAPTLGNMLEQGLGFTIQGQLTNKGENRKRGLEALHDFTMGMLLPLVGKAGTLAEIGTEKAIGKGVISKLTNPATVAGIFYGMGKAQGLDDASALGQAILFGGLHTLSILKDKSPEDAKVYEENLLDRLFDGDRQAMEQAILTYEKTKANINKYFKYLQEFSKTPEWTEIKKEIGNIVGGGDKVYATIPGVPQLVELSKKSPEIFKLFQKGIEKVNKKEISLEALEKTYKGTAEQLKDIDPELAKKYEQLGDITEIQKLLETSDREKLLEEYKKAKESFEEKDQLKADIIADKLGEEITKEYKPEMEEIAKALYELKEKKKEILKPIKGNRLGTQAQSKEIEKNLENIDPMLKNIYDTLQGTPTQKLQKLANMKPDEFLDKTIEIFKEDNPELELIKDNDILRNKVKQAINTHYEKVEKKKNFEKKVEEATQIINYLVIAKDKKKLGKALLKLKRKKLIPKSLTKEIKVLAEQPTGKQIEMLVKKYGKEIIEEGLDRAIKRNIIDEAREAKYREALEKFKKNTQVKMTNQKGKGLTEDQRIALLDMQKYKLNQRIDEMKVNTEEVSKELKKNNLQLELIEPKKEREHRVPFVLLGNKENTFKHHLLPLYLQAIKNGKTIFVEPYGGAGLSIAYLDKLFKTGLEQAHINIFDLEKYNIIKYLHEHGFDEKIAEKINKYHTEIIDRIVEEAIKKTNPEMYKQIKELEELVGAKFGTKEFTREVKEIGLLSPQLAKKFFKENPDAKLAKQGDLTTTFIDWLKSKEEKKLKEELGEKQFESLDEQQLNKILEERVNNILDKSIEKYYPKLSKNIEKIIDEYDRYDKIEEAKTPEEKLDRSLKTAIARKYRFSRSSAGQGVYGPSEGFRNLYNGSWKNFINGLKQYAKNLQTYKDKIHIYNEDGKKFIQERAKQLPHDKSFYYLDPPYIRTTKVYIKNMKDEQAKKALEEYADPDKFKNIIEPIKDTTTILTNDINGKYFSALKEVYGDKLNDKIYGYVEGVTPTSLVHTKDVQHEEGYFTPYMFIKKLKKNTEPLMEAKDKLIKDIGKQVMKFFQTYDKELVKKMKTYDNLIKQLDKSKQLKEEVLDKIEDVGTNQEARKLVSQLRKKVREGKLTGADLLEAITKVEKHFKEIQNRIDKIKKLEKKINSKSFDAEIRQQIKDNILDKLDTTKPPSGKKLRLLHEYLEDGKRTDEHIKVFNEYQQELQNGHDRLNNIHTMGIDKLDQIIEDLEKYIEHGKKWKIQQEKIKEEMKKKAQDAIIEYKPEHISTNQKGIGLKVLKKKLIEKTIKLKQEIEPVSYNLEMIGKDVLDTYYNTIVKSLNKYRDEILKYRIKFQKFYKENKISEYDNTKVAIYGLLKRGDKKGIIKVLAYLTKVGDPLAKSRLKRKIPLTKKEAEKKLGERIAQGEKFLDEKQMKYYNFIREIISEIEPKLKKAYYDTENKYLDTIDDYFPITIDTKENKKWKLGQTEIADNLFHKFLAEKKKVTLERAKKATTLETIPILHAGDIIRGWLSESLYYKNVAKDFFRWNIFKDELQKRKGINGTEWKPYLDHISERIARQGNIPLTKIDRRIEHVIRNYGTAVIGFNPVTIALQTTALLDAHITGAGVKLYGDFMRVIGDRKLREEIIKKSKVIRHREGFDPLFDTDEWIKSSLAKWNKLAFKPMIGVDKLTALAIWINKYEKLKREGKTEMEAIRDADETVNQVVANPHFEDLPKYIYEARGWKKLYGQFQTFIATRYSLWKNKGIKDTFKDKKIIGLMKNILIMYTIYQIEQFIINTTKKKLYDEKPKGQTKTQQVIGMIPFASALYGQSRYGTFPFYSYLTRGIEALEKGDEETATKEVFKALLFYKGIGGANTFYKLFLKNKKHKKNKSTISNNLNLDNLNLDLDLDF